MLPSFLFWVNSYAALLLWSLEEENQAGAIEMPDIPWRRVSLPAAHSLRGPPLA